MNTKLPKGLFERKGVIWCNYYDVKTKRTRMCSTGYPSKKEYIKSAKIFREGKIKEGKQKYAFTPIINTYLSSMLDVFFESKENEITESTKNIYKRAVNALISVLEDKPIVEFTEEDFEFAFRKLKNLHGISQNTRAMYSRHLKALFQYFVKKRMLDFNPVPRIKQEMKSVIIIPKNEIEQILSELKKKKNIYGYDLVKFLYLSGLRIGEAISLKWSDIDFNNKVMIFYNQKAKKKEIFPLNKHLAQHLQEMATRKFSEEKVFVYTSISCAFFYRIQKEIWKEESARYSFHNLRKSHITALAWASGNPLVVKSAGRHSHLNTDEDYYIQIQARIIREEIDSLKIDAFELAV
jgi:integrase